jgi:hypothetical protein
VPPVDCVELVFPNRPPPEVVEPKRPVVVCWLLSFFSPAAPFEVLVLNVNPPDGLLALLAAFPPNKLPDAPVVLVDGCPKSEPPVPVVFLFSSVLLALPKSDPPPLVEDPNNDPEGLPAGVVDGGPDWNVKPPGLGVPAIRIF